MIHGGDSFRAILLQMAWETADEVALCAVVADGYDLKDAHSSKESSQVVQ